MRKKLTDDGVARLRPVAGQRLEVQDAVCPNLVVRVTAKGVRTFSVLYRMPGAGGVSPTGRELAGPQQRLTLGKWPALDVEHAREQARQVASQVARGVDPRDETRRRRGETFGVVAERFMELEARPHIASWRNVRAALDTHLLPAWRDRPLGTIKRGDVHALLDAIVASGKPGAAREVRKHASRIFGWAVDRELVEANPLYKLRRKDLNPNPHAGRALADDELRAVWLAAGELGYPWDAYFRLLLLTGARRSEIAEARASDLDRGRRVLNVPAMRQKSGRDHLIPLVGPAWSLVQELPTWTAVDDPYLFSACAGAEPIRGFVHAKERLDDAAARVLGRELRPYRLHDLRVTCRTRLAALRVPAEVGEAVLGHAKQGLVGVYNKWGYLEEKRDALRRYGEHVLALVAGPRTARTVRRPRAAG